MTLGFIVQCRKQAASMMRQSRGTLRILPRFALPMPSRAGIRPLIEDPTEAAVGDDQGAGDDSRQARPTARDRIPPKVQ